MKLWVSVTHDDDNSFTAISPSLPGCVSRGESADDALRRHRANVMGYLASATNFVPDSLTFDVAKAVEKAQAV